MKSSVVAQLIYKDCRLCSTSIVFPVAGGIVGLAILQKGGEVAFVLGAAFFFLSLVFCASFLPASNVINERKKQTLPFLMSLPVSSVQYGVSKLVSTVGMFLIPWLTLVGGAFWLIMVRHTLPNGAIPMTLILSGIPLVGFCFITGTALVVETEAWGIAATAFVNSTYWLEWYLLVRQYPELTRDFMSRTPVWSPAALGILAAESALVILFLGVTLYIQSRKRDFV